MNGVLILDKPAEFTSFDAVAVMRGISRERKIGHTGTLDPMATGVLPLLLGRAAKAADLLPDTTKEYAAGFKIGKKSDTGDIWGKITQTSEVKIPFEVLLKSIECFRGEIMQIPPMYSAVSVGGQRLYKLARQGIEIEREARKVEIAELEVLEYNPEVGEGKLKISCSKGTYIRTLIEDIAEKVGSCAVMTSLRRTRACGFDESDALTLDEVKALAKAGEFSKIVKPTDSLFSYLTAVNVSREQAVRFLNGGFLSASRVKELQENAEQMRVYAPSGLFLGLGKLNTATNEIEILKLFADKADLI